MARTVSSSVWPGADLGADRQQRLARFRHHRAHPGDGERVVAGLRQVGEQGAHVGGRLEPVLRRDAAAVQFGQRAALGDAQQRVVRLVHVRLPEVAVVGRHQRDAARVGEPDQAGFDRGLHRQAVAMQLLDGAAGEGCVHRVQQAFSFRLLALGEQAANRSGGPAGQQQQARRVLGDPLERQLRLQGRVSVQEAERRQPLQVGHAGRVLRQEDHRVGRQAQIVAAGDADLATDDGLDALAGTVLGELQGAEQVAGVGDRRRGHPRLFRQSDDLVRADGALAKRVGGMGSEMDEVSVRHPGSLADSAESGQETLDGEGR